MSSNADFLFPTPSTSPSTLSPYHWPGVSTTSTQALKDVLNENHKRWHIFFNDQGFHNHISHQTIAIWALGADQAVIRAAYELHAREQRPAFKSPTSVTEDNFHEHLGDERFYEAYMKFFTDQVRKHGVDNTLESFLFSKKHNIGKKRPEMLSRFLAGLVHPMIHTGYGAEFSLPGMIIEGLAQTCVHRPDVSKLLPETFFSSIYAITDKLLANTPSTVVNATRKIESIAEHLNPQALNHNISPANSSSPVSQPIYSSYRNEGEKDSDNVHALTILAHVMADSRLSRPENMDELHMIQSVIAQHADLISEYASRWTVNLSKPGEIDRKIEEIIWMNVVMYGVGGWTWAQQVKKGQDGDFNADFFLVHLVTSTAFLPSLADRVSHSPHAQVLLLRSYFTVCLAWYITRGRPKLDIRAFFTSSTATAYPLPVNVLPTPHKDTLPGQDKAQARIPNPWLPLVQTTVVHPDEHLAKAVRALANWSSKFGTAPAGSFSGPSSSSHSSEKIGSADAVQEVQRNNVTNHKEGSIKTGLEGAQFLDGTLFVRVAGLTVARMGRVGQGERPAEFWDRQGFF